MPARLRYQYTVTATLLKPQGGIEVEVTKEYPNERPGAENVLQGSLEEVLGQLEFPDDSLAKVAERLHNIMQQLGGHMHSVRARRGAQLITVYIDAGD